METNFVLKNPHKYLCELCHYSTCNLKDYKKHNETKKHIKVTMETNGSKMETNGNHDDDHICNKCNKKYKTRSGLWKHYKNCKLLNESKNTVLSITDSNINNIIEVKDKQINDLRNMIFAVMNQNQELMCENKEIIKMLQDTVPKIGNTNNSHNKTFNLSVFLNETCKDAMNIMDFVDSLKLQLSDLEDVGKLGYVEGISNIIVKNLKALDITKRPVHCSDSKREVIYIKDDDKWEKENEDNDKLRKVITHVMDKNIRLLPLFKEKFPDCIYSHSKKSDQYNKLIIESMGGSGNNQKEKENKIIKRIVKEVIIKK